MTLTLTPMHLHTIFVKGRSAHVSSSLQLFRGPSQSTDLNLNSQAPHPLLLQFPNLGPADTSATLETSTPVPLGVWPRC